MRTYSLTASPSVLNDIAYELLFSALKHAQRAQDAVQRGDGENAAFWTQLSVHVAHLAQIVIEPVATGHPELAHVFGLSTSRAA